MIRIAGSYEVSLKCIVFQYLILLQVVHVLSDQGVTTLMHLKKNFICNLYINHE